VIALVEQIETELGPIEAFVFNIGANVPCSILEHRSLTSFVVVVGTAVGSRTDRQLFGTHVLRRTPRFTRVTKTTTLPTLAGRQSNGQNAFCRVAIDQVSLA